MVTLAVVGASRVGLIHSDRCLVFVKAAAVAVGQAIGGQVLLDVARAVLLLADR